MKQFLSLVTAGFIAAAIPQASAQQGDQWIVLGSDAASVLQSRLANRLSEPGGPGFTSLGQRNGLTVARMDPGLAGELHSMMHENFRRCGGYTVHPSLDAALAERNNPIYQPGYVWPEGVFPTELTEAQSVNQALGQVNRTRIISTIQTLQNLGTRYYQTAQGAQAATTVANLWAGFGAGRADFSVERVNHAWAQDSVIATIRGSVYPDEVVVIGGHLDSINGADTSDAPGADDNASGIAVVSEVLKVLTDIDFKPKRTLKFMAYAAEEVGLRGSGDIATAFEANGTTVNGVLQFDMTGFAGSSKHMYFVTDFVNPNATAFLKRLIAEYNSSGAHTITWGETQCGYACSDHASWTSKGFPSAFPFESAFADYNRTIHSPDDLVANQDASGRHQERFAKLGVEFAIEMAKAADSPAPPKANRYKYTTMRVIGSGSSRGCSVSDWSCMSRLCKADLNDQAAWRGWAGCWRDGSKFQCMFECGKNSTFH